MKHINLKPFYLLFNFIILFGSCNFFKDTNNKNQQKQLKYLYASNGGMRAYYSDGTVVGCPQCDFLKENIDAMETMKPFTKYEQQSDGSLLVEGYETEMPKYEIDHDWKMINFKWNEKLQ